MASEEEEQYDTIHMGRSSIDLYSNDIGSPFTGINSFAAYVGGSPLNFAVGAHRLGLQTVLLTGLGQDPVGDFIDHFLRNEGVVTKFIPRNKHRTSAVLLGIEPPSKFPLVYYRENCADINLTIDDVIPLPFKRAKIFQFAGTNLSREPSRSATMFAAELANQNNLEVVFDVDFRPDQWHDVRAFGVAARSVLRLVDIVVGTEDEINASMVSADVSVISVSESVSDTQVKGNVEDAISRLFKMAPKVKAVVEKRGPQGARLHIRDLATQRVEVVDVPGYPVEVYCILGAGDAFGAGFLYGYVRGWGWYKSARLGNACGAIVVTKHGCANFMPTMAQVEEFVSSRGGF
eukprot:GILJ01004267.1.p1 GENE.GILJ01004267.1~~GILJ01004267.1.p1  ORF type:complete len:360 (-),score=35.98 GILJ01004267.1:167-1207(-)